jgi:hypothetical protein
MFTPGSLQCFHKKVNTVQTSRRKNSVYINLFGRNNLFGKNRLLPASALVTKATSNYGF